MISIPNLKGNIEYGINQEYDSNDVISEARFNEGLIMGLRIGNLITVKEYDDLHKFIEETAEKRKQWLEDDNEF